MSNSLPLPGEADKKLGADLAPLSVTAQDVPSMVVNIRAGSFWNVSSAIVQYNGGTATIVAPSGSYPRWTLVSLDTTGAVVLTNGTQANSPTIPTPPANNLPLAAIYVKPTTTTITPYMIQDVRPVIRSETDTSTFQTQLDAKAPLVSPQFSGTVILPTTTSVGNVSSTELGYLNGVTSLVQNQIDTLTANKQATITGAATTITTSNLAVSKAVVSDASGKIAAATTTSTELGYVAGVTSAIQTQLDAKAPLASPTFTGSVTLPSYTVAQVNAPLASVIGAIIFVSDANTGVGTVAFGDGSGWIDIKTGVAVA